MWKSLAMVSFLSCLGLPSSEGEVYTSVEELTDLFFLEKRIVGALSQYLTKTEKKLERIRRYLRDYEFVRTDEALHGRSADSRGDELERLAGNPLHAFHLMKRFAVDWKYIIAQRTQEDWKGVEEAITSGDADLLASLPVEEDLHGAARALLRLQNVYKLNTSTLVRGNVLGVLTSAELRAQDCLYMGKHSFNLGMYQNAIQWFEEAYTLASIEKNATITTSQVSEFISVTHHAQKEKIMHEEDSISHLQSNGFNPYSITAEKTPPKAPQYPLVEEISISEEHQNFDALCRGEQLLKESYKRTLKCYYDHRGSPFLLLMPMKVEKHFHDPQILVFRDILTDAEIQTMKEIAKPALSRGLVQGVKGNTISNVRTSKVAWIDENIHPIMERLSRRIAVATGLATDTSTGEAEIMQIANYGTGGHYSPHFDYLLADKKEEELKSLHPKEIELGDRIATFMFYLSDVLRGGATVFPKLGVTLWPSKGTAAFWYNLKQSGEGDRRTLHGACPVVYGSKWVGNKWIRERGQFKKRRCGLINDE